MDDRIRGLLVADSRGFHERENFAPQLSEVLMVPHVREANVGWEVSNVLAAQFPEELRSHRRRV